MHTGLIRKMMYRLISSSLFVALLLRGATAYGEDNGAAISTVPPLYGITTNPPSQNGGTINLGVDQGAFISSPNYPSNYPDNVNQEWHIVSPSFYYGITVNFTDFNTQGCCDIVRVYAGETPAVESRTEISQFSGSSVPLPIKSRQRYLWVVFQSDSTITHTGYEAEVRAYDLREFTVICDPTSMTLLMDKTLLDDGNQPEDVHFTDTNCVGYNHDDYTVGLLTPYNECGTVQSQEATDIVFSNVVTYHEPRPSNESNAVITHEHVLRIDMQCNLGREQVLGNSYTPSVGIVTINEDGFGEFTLSLERYETKSFTQQVNESAKVVLHTPIYFGVNLTAVTDLTVFIEKCWATPSPNPADSTNYLMIENGCAIDQTIQFYNFLDPTFEGFEIDAFAFVNDADQVFVHCAVIVCDSDDHTSRCTQGCLGNRKRRSASEGTSSKPHTISVGPLSAETTDASFDQDSQGLTMDPITIIALSAFCVFTVFLGVIAAVVVRKNRQSSRKDYEQRLVGE